MITIGDKKFEIQKIVRPETIKVSTTIKVKGGRIRASLYKKGDDSLNSERLKFHILNAEGGVAPSTYHEYRINYEFIQNLSPEVKI